MTALQPGEIPSIEQLEAAGADAGALMDATRAELERAIESAQDKATRTAFADQLKALEQRHREYFGGNA